MDERTRKTDDELAPNLRRTAPEPVVKSRRFSAVRVGVGLIVVVALALGVYQIARWVAAPTAPTGRFAQGGVQSVGAATVALNNVPVLVNALGTVTPIATVTVQSQISGYLTQVPFKEGQMVQKGDLLAQIDDRPYVILKAQYEGQLAHDQGLLSQAQMDLKRYQTLAQQNSIARQQAEDQVFIVQQYEGTVKQDQGLIDAQTLNIAYCHIVSPVTGRIGLRLVDPGNYVQSASATGIAVVTELQPITVIFSIPEDDLPEIMPQVYAGTKLQVTAFDRANVKQLAVGSVSAVDSQINTTTGTVNVRAQFDNTDNALFPNQFVNAQLLVKTLQNAVTVPTAAIQRGAPGGTPRRRHGHLCLSDQCQQHRLGATDQRRPDLHRPAQRQHDHRRFRTFVRRSCRDRRRRPPARRTSRQRHHDRRQAGRADGWSNDGYRTKGQGGSIATSRRRHRPIASRQRRQARLRIDAT